MHERIVVEAHDPEGNLPNVGPLGAALRVALALVLVVLVGLALRTFPVDRAFTIFIHGALTVAYLLISGLSRFDPFFVALRGPTRVHAPDARRERRRGGRPIG